MFGVLWPKPKSEKEKIQKKEQENSKKEQDERLALLLKKNEELEELVLFSKTRIDKLKKIVSFLTALTIFLSVLVISLFAYYHGYFQKFVQGWQNIEPLVFIFGLFPYVLYGYLFLNKRIKENL